MFNHIGSKIKGFSKFLFWLSAISGLIAGLVLMIVGAINADDTPELVLFIFLGLFVMIGGFLLAWVQTFVLYGYGELVDSNQKILELLEEQKGKK